MKLNIIKLFTANSLLYSIVLFFAIWDTLQFDKPSIPLSMTIYYSSLFVFYVESTYKKCLREEWGKFTGYQLLSSFWLKVARTDEDGNTTRWDRGTLPIRNLYHKWWMLRFGRIRKVTNWILILWFRVSY